MGQSAGCSVRDAPASVERGALGPRSIHDARHIALATVAGVDVLVSWNFHHIANFRRLQAYNRVNRDLGYGPVDIRTPDQVRETRHGY